MPLEKGRETPCHGCPDRYTACSDHCQKEAFLKWRQELATIRANREKNRINDGSLIYVSMLPDASSSLTITASTDKRETYREKEIGSNLFSFTNMDFSRFSFDMNRTPKIRRVRLKVKKFVYYKLIFKVEEAGAQTTVLSFDQQVRFSSLVK